MAELMRVEIDNKTIYVEVEEVNVRAKSSYGIEDTSGLDKGLAKVGDAFEQVKLTIMSIANSLYKTVHSVDQVVTPNEFQLEFAIKFGAEGQAFLAKASGEASLKVTMIYKHE